MRLVRQKHPEGCGVAVFAMLTDQGWAAAAEQLGFAGEAIDVTQLRYALESRGWFLRKLWARKDSPGGIWPPRPFAPRHFAMVTQPSGNGHFLAVEADGTVFDPLTDEPRRLDEWTICHELTGLLR